MTTFRAEFFTAADWTFRAFEAETPAQALEAARQFYADNLGELDFQSYDAIEPLDRVQIWDAERGELASWESEDYRLRLAATDLLESLEGQTEAAQAVVDSWEKGDLAGAVNALSGWIDPAREAIAKAKGGRS